MSLTAFANRLVDPIANVTLGKGPGIFPGVGFVAGDYRQRLNVAAITVRGVEASGEIRSGFWSLRLGGSYTDARVKADGAAAALDGLRPAQTPNFVLTSGLGWEKDGSGISLAVRHAGPQYEDDLNGRKLPAATTVDAFAAWPLGRRIQLVLRAENLLDETVVAGSPTTASRNAEPRARCGSASGSERSTVADISRRPDRWRVPVVSLIDALSARAPSIVVFTLIAALVCAWFGAPVWMPTALAIAVAALALLLFAARGGRDARREPGDERSWLEWELAGKGMPPGAYLLGFFAFVTIMLTGIESSYSMPAWAALALALVWGIANRHYPREPDGEL